MLDALVQAVRTWLTGPPPLTPERLRGMQRFEQGQPRSNCGTAEERDGWDEASDRDLTQG